MATSNIAQEVTVSLPASSRYLATCRLNVSSFASIIGFSIEELEDLRLATSEAITWLLQDTDSGILELRLRETEGSLHFVARRNGLAPEPADMRLNALTEVVLDATVDNYECSFHDGYLELSFHKALPVHG
jgi:serine/threonine-protein kinase RsbW